MMEGKEDHYVAALQASRIANRAYHEACLKYRALQIGDAEFLKAREEMVVARVAFDQAEHDLKYAD